jgi:c-di-GMP-binding flagellar brake protein YcgR
LLRLIKLSSFILVAISLGGCGAFSATSLRCGTDGDSSYVEVVSAPQSISQNTRALSELCAFGFVGDEDG